MCTVIDLLRTLSLIEEERVLIKIEFSRAIIMFELLCASIEVVRTNCVPIRLRYKINIWFSINVAFDIFLILFSFLVYTWLQLGYIKVSQSLMKLLYKMYKHVAYGTLRNVAYGTPN